MLSGMEYALLGGAIGFCAGRVIRTLINFGAIGAGLSLAVVALFGLSIGGNLSMDSPLFDGYGSAMFSALFNNLLVLAGTLGGVILGLRRD